jgi:hypothetical protein
MTTDEFVKPTLDTVMEALNQTDGSLRYVNERRVGRFCIPFSVLETCSDQDWIAIMRPMRIIRAEYDVLSACIVYDAFSPDFEIVPFGEDIPRYKLSFLRDAESNQPLMVGVERLEVVRTRPVMADLKVVRR